MPKKKTPAQAVKTIENVLKMNDLAGFGVVTSNREENRHVFVHYPRWIKAIEVHSTEKRSYAIPEHFEGEAPITWDQLDDLKDSIKALKDLEDAYLHVFKNLDYMKGRMKILAKYHEAQLLGKPIPHPATESMMIQMREHPDAPSLETAQEYCMVVASNGITQQMYSEALVAHDLGKPFRVLLHASLAVMPLPEHVQELFGEIADLEVKYWADDADLREDIEIVNEKGTWKDATETPERTQESA